MVSKWKLSIPERLNNKLNSGTTAIYKKEYKLNSIAWYGKQPSPSIKLNKIRAIHLVPVW